MAKLSKKTVEKVLDDFKAVYFISEALDSNGVRPFDFFEYLSKNEEASKEYETIDKFNNVYKEAQIEQKVYSSEFSKQILLEMIKAKDKKKYVQKLEIEDVSPVSAMSDEELARRIADLKSRLPP